MESKVCSTCRTNNPISLYNWNRQQNRYNSQCRSCATNGQRRRHETLDGRIKHSLSTSKRRPQFNDLTFEQLVTLWEKQNGLCAISGAPLSCKGNSQYTASIDRIDSQKGYTLSNVQWVCYEVNMMKRGLSMDDFVSWSRKIADFSRT